MGLAVAASIAGLLGGGAIAVATAPVTAPIAATIAFGGLVGGLIGWGASKLLEKPSHENDTVREIQARLAHENQLKEQQRKNDVGTKRLEEERQHYKAEKDHNEEN